MSHTLLRDRSALVIEHMTDEAEWDAFVASAPGATFCHAAAWQRILSAAMGHETHYLIARDEAGAPAGVLPLVRLRSRVFGDRYVSVPYLNDGGPLGEPPAVMRLAAHASELAARDRARLELRMRAPLPGTVESIGVRPRKVTVLLDLPAEADGLWSRLPSKVRSQVRRPQKAGLTVRFGPEELPAFYRVWSRNMRDLGTPVLPRRFFEAILAAMPDRFLVGCVYRDDEPIAAGAGFGFGDEVEITWASALREHSRDAPNMLLYWEFMSRSIERGARVFNFGRCTPGEGTHRFKLQWGGTTVPLPWWPTPEGDGGPGRAARLASTAWQRLPMPIAERIGPVLARRLPWW